MPVRKKPALGGQSLADRRKKSGTGQPGVTAKRRGVARPKKVVRPKKSARPKKSVRAQTSARPRKKGAAPENLPLGRPKISGEERLFLLFKEDYHARQIFEFLQVEKVKDLEQYSPQQIVRMLSRPITQTVERIRRKLADKNRCLRDDAEFATEITTKHE